MSPVKGLCVFSLSLRPATLRASASSDVWKFRLIIQSEMATLLLPQLTADLSTSQLYSGEFTQQVTSGTSDQTAPSKRSLTQALVEV